MPFHTGTYPHLYHQYACLNTCMYSHVYCPVARFHGCLRLDCVYLQVWSCFLARRTAFVRVWMYAVSHSYFYHTSKPECAIPDDKCMHKYAYMLSTCLRIECVNLWMNIHMYLHTNVVDCLIHVFGIRHVCVHFDMVSKKLVNFKKKPNLWDWACWLRIDLSYTLCVPIHQNMSSVIAVLGSCG